MKNLKVSNYELREEQIIVHASTGDESIEYAIGRMGFEDWLTEGSGVVDMSFTHCEGGVITEVPIKEPIANYWQLGSEVADGPVLEHLRFYLTRDNVAVSALKAEFAEERLRRIFSDMEPVQRADAYATLLEYGILKKEYGEQSASRVFRRVFAL